MKTITAIYLNCQPDLRDEWLAAADIENDVEDSNVSVEYVWKVLIMSHTLDLISLGGGGGFANSRPVLPQPTLRSLHGQLSS